MQMAAENDWQTVYEQNRSEDLPWYVADLDPDVHEAIKKMKIAEGSFIDLGTGPATQALGLEKLGFQVTGVDIAKTAISRAKKLSKKSKFVCADVLDLDIGKFDYALDRGCFHTLVLSQRTAYVKSLARSIKKKGIVFLKCFSVDEPGSIGPYKYSADEIRRVFDSEFEILSIKKTVFQGTRHPQPKALLVVMKKK
jgi:SAM-dependent methyltransferase